LDPLSGRERGLATPLRPQNLGSQRGNAGPDPRLQLVEDVGLCGPRLSLGRASQLRVEWLPGYAPDLNPVETLWGNIKGQELANRCADDLAEADTAIRSGMTRVRRSSHLPISFLKHAGLSF